MYVTRHVTAPPDIDLPDISIWSDSPYFMFAWRACLRHSNRLYAWRHIAEAGAPTLLSVRNGRAYHNPSFSGRPNTLTSWIWYRKDGVPRSSGEGVVAGFSVTTTIGNTLVLLTTLGSVDRMARLLSLGNGWVHAPTCGQ